ncbi:MAG: hypothetical protein IPI83_15720 [Sphingomonadales bacterium]|nr:hypothetical protein [Sphingomonadales bacterium]
MTLRSDRPSGAPSRLAATASSPPAAELDRFDRPCRPAAKSGTDVIAPARRLYRPGAALGIDWAQGAATELDPRDPWGAVARSALARDFQAMRLEFLARKGGKTPRANVESWLSAHTQRVASFRHQVNRARRTGAQPTPGDARADRGGQVRGNRALWAMLGGGGCSVAPAQRRRRNLTNLVIPSGRMIPAICARAHRRVRQILGTDGGRGPHQWWMKQTGTE